jgi:hypothetical protein
MNPRDLVHAALRGDDLAVRQYVKDAARSGFSWASAPPPNFSGPRPRAVYAGLVELMASRSNEKPPAWTRTVAPAPGGPVFLVRLAKKSKVLQKESLRSTPEPLKKRNVFALRDYLDVL